MISQRQEWPDVAKGLCIVLVVLWHVVTKHSLGVPDAGVATQIWASINAQLLPLRMPLFFLISGMFAVRAVMASDGASWRRRAARLALLYVIWVLVQTFALALAPDFDTARAENVGELFAQLTFAPTNLWYLLALAVYFAVARACRAVPTAALLSVACVVASVASTGILPDSGNLWQLFQNLFFFLAGTRLRPQIEHFAAAASLRRMCGLCAVYATALGALWVASAQGSSARDWPGVGTLLSLLAVALGIVFCVLLDRHLRMASRMLRWLGQRTLPIYVIHMIPLAVFDMWLRDATWMSGLPIEATAPLVLTAVVIAISIGVHSVLLLCRLGVLFDPLPNRSDVGVIR